MAFFYIFVSYFYIMAIINNPRANAGTKDLMSPKAAMSRVSSKSAMSAPNDLMEIEKRKRKKKKSSSNTNKRGLSNKGGCKGIKSMPGGR